MSAGYGYYYVSICKSNGAADEAKAKDVFDYCSNTFDWFSDENRFVLEENIIRHNDEEFCDGLYIKNADIPVDFDWLCEAQSNTGAERIVAEIIEDFSESSYDENYVHHALIEGGEIIREFNAQYDRGIEFNGFPIDDFGEIDSGSYYPMMNSQFCHYAAKFKNKKTGQEILGGRIDLYPNEEYEEDGIFSAAHGGETHFVFSNGDQGTLLDENGDPCEIYNFDHFSDDYDIMADFEFPSDASDWEFVGFATQPTWFELYANEKVAKELEVVY